MLQLPLNVLLESLKGLEVQYNKLLRQGSPDKLQDGKKKTGNQKRLTITISTCEAKP